MDDFLRATVLTVEAFFGQRRKLRLPWFQRAYAWREDHVLRLLTDVLAAMDGPKQRYSLGTIHLAGPIGANSMAIVDGHQRTITLEMLFAILRDVTTADVAMPEDDRRGLAHRLQLLIEDKTDGAAALPEHQWRLETQPQISTFFERFVQLPDATLNEPPSNLGKLTPIERNLIANREALLSRLAVDVMPSQTRRRLIAFLLERCHLVTIEVDNEDEAWSMLDIEQVTRLPHDTSELSKIALIYTMPSTDQEAAGRIWEQAQAQIGSERMSEVITHIRTAKLEKRSNKPVESDLQRLFALDRDGLDFMNKVVLPNVDALQKIDTKQLGTGTLANEISRHLNVLSWLDHRHWVAPALLWLTTKGDQHPVTEQFFFQLERLAWMLRLAGTDPNEQENRFVRLTAAVNRQEPVNRWPEFKIAQPTIVTALNILRSRTFYYKHTCGRVLRRLSFVLGADPGPIDGAKVSIEHILPRNPPKERSWNLEFKSEEAVLAFTDRLGNLALLTGTQNRKADTNDWPTKRKILKASGFKLSLEAAENATWTAKIIDARTEKMIRLLFAQWDLPIK